MEGLIVCSLLRRDDPLFQQEESLLLKNARLFDVELSFCSAFDCESILLSRCKKLGFVYFYEEDLNLEDIAVRLGIPTFSNPKNYVSGHDLSAFYRLLKLVDIPTPIAYACPNLKGVRLSDCFELLSLRMKETGVNYPLCLRKRDECGCYKTTLCLTPMEFNASMKDFNQTPFVAEEFVDGPLLLALVVGKKCVGVIENKGEEYAKSPLDNRFVRHEAAMAAKAVDRENALILFKRCGNTPVCVGVSSDLHLALFSCVYMVNFGERFFAYLLRARRKKKVFAYTSFEEVKAERKKLER